MRRGRAEGGISRVEICSLVLKDPVEGSFFRLQNWAVGGGHFTGVDRKPENRELIDATCDRSHPNAGGRAADGIE